MRKFIRKLEWKFIVKKYLTAKISELPFGYPLLVFIEFEGREKYIDLGFKKFIGLLVSKLENSVNSTTEILLETIKEQERISNLSPEEHQKETLRALRKMAREINAQGSKEREEEILKCDKLIKEIDERKSNRR